MGTATIASANVCQGTSPSDCTPTGLITFNSAPASQAFGDGGSGDELKMTAFSDTYQFDVTAPPTFNTVSFSETSVGGTLNNLLISLYSCGLTACDLGTGSLVTSSSTNVGVISQEVSISAAGLNAGYYYVDISSSGAAEATDSYAGDLSISPAPLPGTLALFAGGLGLLGFARGRKSRKDGRALSSLTA
jgi:hypothetical protein